MLGSSKVRIRQIKTNFLMSNMYVITEGIYSLLIDTYMSEEVAEDIISSTNPEGIILTHEHFDHISGVNLFKEKFTGKIPVYASAPCARNLRDPRKNFSRYYDVFCKMQKWIGGNQQTYNKDYVCLADEVFTGYTMLNWHGHEIKLFEAPGHSDGSILIFIDNQYLFSGDTLFEDFPINTRPFVGGSIDKFTKITKPILASFPEDTVVFPGHFAPFKLNNQYQTRSEKNHA